MPLSIEGRWCPAAAHHLARRAALEYSPSIDAGCYELDAATEAIVTDRSSEVECSYVRCRRWQVITFRGTEPAALADWLTDARIYRRRWAGPGRVHRGFAGAVETVLPVLAVHLVADRPLWLTGHSLGAALATHAAGMIRVHHRHVPIGGLYTFGSPRVYNRKAALWLEGEMPGRIWRVVNNNDVVTRVPLSNLVSGYWHVGELAYLDVDGRIVHSPSRWEVFRDRVRGRLEALAGGEPTVREVPGLAGEVADRLEAHGLARLSQVLAAGAAGLIGVPGVGQVVAARIIAWAVHRAGERLDLAAAAFDGTADHAIGGYVERLAPHAQAAAAGGAAAAPPAP